MLSSQVTPAPVLFSQYFVALNCCSKWLILLRITLPGLSTLIHLTLMIWHIYNRFCSTIPLITTAPLIVIATFSQPINPNYHGIDVRSWAIVMSWHSSFGFTCSSLTRCLNQCFPQSNGPSPNDAINFLEKLGWITFLHSTTSHFSKLLSSFRHFEHSLHVWSICNF